MALPENTGPLTKILIVDDDRDILEMTGLLLRNAGYDVVGVSTYPEVEAVIGENPLPSLVLMDVRMPVRDGFWIAEKIRSEFNIPIVFMTAHDCPKYRLYAPIAGAAAYIQKPFEVEFLLATVESVLATSTSKFGNAELLKRRYPAPLS